MLANILKRLASDFLTTFPVQTFLNMNNPGWLMHWKMPGRTMSTSGKLVILVEPCPQRPFKPCPRQKFDLCSHMNSNHVPFPLQFSSRFDNDNTTPLYGSKTILSQRLRPGTFDAADSPLRFRGPRRIWTRRFRTPLLMYSVFSIWINVLQDIIIQV